MSRVACLVVAASVVVACGDDGATTPDAGVDTGAPADAYVDLSGPVFEPNHIVDVSITLACSSSIPG